MLYCSHVEVEGRGGEGRGKEGRGRGGGRRGGGGEGRLVVRRRRYLFILFMCR